MSSAAMGERRVLTSWRRGEKDGGQPVGHFQSSWRRECLDIGFLFLKVGMRGQAYGNLVRHAVLSEDVSGDDPRLLGFGDVADARRENGVAVVGLAIFGEEADEALDVYELTAGPTVCKG